MSEATSSSTDFEQKAAQQMILPHPQISHSQSGYRLGELTPFAVRSWNEV